MDFYLYASSKDSKEGFPYDRAGNFIVELPKEIILDGQWEVSLSEIALYRTPKDQDPRHIYICSPIVDTSICGQFQYPILRRIPLKKQSRQLEEYTTEYFFPVNQTRLKRLNIYTLDDKLGTELFNASDILDITLHFRRKPLRLCY